MNMNMKMNLLNDENIIISNILKLDDNKNLNKIILSYIYSLPIEKLYDLKEKYLENSLNPKSTLTSSNYFYCSSLRHFSDNACCIFCDRCCPIYFHLDQDNNFYNIDHQVKIPVQNNHHYNYLVCIYCMFHIFTNEDNYDFYNFTTDHEININCYDQIVSRLKPFVKFNYYFGQSQNQCNTSQKSYFYRSRGIERQCSIENENTFCSTNNAYFKDTNITIDRYEDVNKDENIEKVQINGYECNLCRGYTKRYTLIDEYGYNRTQCRYYNTDWILICDDCAPRNTNSVKRSFRVYIKTDNRVINLNKHIQTPLTKGFLGDDDLFCDCYHEVESKLLFIYKFCTYTKLKNVYIT